MNIKPIAPKRSGQDEVMCGNGCKEVLAVPVAGAGALRPKKGFTLIRDGSWGLPDNIKDEALRKQAQRDKSAAGLLRKEQQKAQREAKQSFPALADGVGWGGNKARAAPLPTGGAEKLRLRCPSCDAVNEVCVADWLPNMLPTGSPERARKSPFSGREEPVKIIK